MHTLDLDELGRGHRGEEIVKEEKSADVGTGLSSRNQLEWAVL